MRQRWTFKPCFEGFASIGPGNVLVTAINGGFQVQSQGTLAALPDLQLVTARAAATASVSTRSTTVATLTVSGTGVYDLTDGTDYVALPVDGDAAAIQAALETFASIGNNNVVVTAVAGIPGSFQNCAVDRGTHHRVHFDDGSSSSRCGQYFHDKHHGVNANGHRDQRRV